MITAPYDDPNDTSNDWEVEYPIITIKLMMRRMAIGALLGMAVCAGVGLYILIFC